MAAKPKLRAFIRKSRRRAYDRGRLLRWVVWTRRGDEIYTWTKASAERIRSRLARGLDVRAADYF